MTVVPLKSLPLGFRFRPTDEQLVNHYLKRKINGRIRSEVEVIPEVDVCKCEPWDLPDKALIKSDDPEWFFFAPKDRKYTNGNRSNRATRTGYWKATGRDRTIKTKTPAAPGVIGMKKTLVFHQGRAPKGVRTCWIMHEYKATEPEFESGEQGGFVLYRLFKKSEEKSPSWNGDEMEDSGFSPDPIKSSPGDTQHEADAFEELGTPIMVAPLSQISPVSDIQGELESFPSAADKQLSGVIRRVPDKADYSFVNPEDSNDYSHTIVEQEIEAGAVVNKFPNHLQHVDPLQDVLAPLCSTKDEQMDSDGFPNVTVPITPYSSDPLFRSTDEDSHMGFNHYDYFENDSMNEILNLTLSNEDGYSEVQSLQQISNHQVKHSHLSNTFVSEEGVGLHVPGCFSINTTSDHPEIDGAVYENTGLLPHDSTGPDAYSLDSGAEYRRELFNSVQESCAQTSNCINEAGLQETRITGIKIKPRQPQHPALDNSSTQQGFARRRIRLQCSVQNKAVHSSKSVIGSNHKDNDDGDEAVKAQDDGIVNRNANLATASFTKLEDLSISDDTTASLNMKESHLSSKSQETKLALRLRTKSTEETLESHKLEKADGVIIRRPRRDMARGYVICLIALMTILVLLTVGVGIWRWKKPACLFVPGDSV